MYKNFFSGIIIASLIAGSTGLTSCQKKSAPLPDKSYNETINLKGWSYVKEDNVYYKTGIIYVSKPVDLKYQTLGVYIPGQFVKAKKDSDGTYTIKAIQQEAAYVMPVNTPGYSACPAPESYSPDIKEYTDAGLIYLSAGARGREHGAPLGVTDYKAAIRYIRHNKEILPGNTDLIFTFGMSGGGAQSAILGASGDSELYDPYLEEAGAIMTESDSVTGSMDWCPITNLNVANEAYEWEMGSTRSDLSEFEKYLSEELGLAFCSYIDSLELKDENGNKLTLVSYQDYLKKTIEDSLNTFIATTEFPYNPDNKNGMPKPDMGPGNERPEGMPEDMPEGKPGNKPEGKPAEFKGGKPDGMPKDKPEQKPQTNGHQPPSFEEKDGIQRKNKSSSGLNLNKTFDSIEDYIAALNEKTTWVKYDSQTKKASITSIQDFFKYLKPAVKSVGAFDDLNGDQGENILFGYGDGKGVHFDKYMTALLKDTIYYPAYAEDINKKDFLGKSLDYRMDLYNPMYFLSSYYNGYGKSKPAAFWRIRSGICQGDTAISTELMLKLALKNYGPGIKDVDFATVWGLGHTEAEIKGKASSNFIEWVLKCVNTLNTKENK
ncbi:subtype A tannase [Treponema sp.]|uniref:subtype A tannase n=1 Tax=Treponema sp. TaxID=166 RepID=UPI0025D12973|nr:subtype A tannase [Treponema sp.]MCR5217469.1 hypothetical protein [Treponema sp.]